MFTYQLSGEAGPAQEAALPAGIGDSSSLARAGFKGGVTLASASGPPSAHEPPVATDAERYAVEEEIARGGMGQILRAGDRDLRREVAMKVMLEGMDEKDRARFVEEAQVTAQLEHPNIVPVHELGIDGEGRLFFTMKLVKGRSLGELLKGLREKPDDFKEYTLGRLLGVFVNVCNAMAFAHSKGVVHRDLKPANLMVGGYGEVLVMDWGLAKVGAAKKGATERGGKAAAPDPKMDALVKSVREETGGALTVDGAVMGTPFYMPPEQAQGEIQRIDERSDIYSLGAILYEILTLKPPVEGTTLPAILKNVAEGNVARPEARAPGRAIPMELSAVSMKALSLRPEDRYATAEALRRDIELYLEGRAVSAKADTAWETLVKLIRRNKGASVALGVSAGVILAIVSAAFWVNLRERREADRQRAAAQDALSAFKAEEVRRLAQQKATAPLLFDRARRAALSSDFKGALQDGEIAVSLDPAHTEARILRAELLIATKDYPRAEVELREYLKLKPDDKDAAALLALATDAKGAETPTIAAALLELFLKRERYALMEPFVQDRDRLLELYNARLRKAWPDKTAIVRLEPQWGLALNITSLAIEDLSPLHGLPLNQLWLQGVPTTSIEPLRGMPLKYLNLLGTRVSDLSPVRGMPLKILDLGNTPVSDLSPLKGAPLEVLNLQETKVADLSPLAGMPLRHLLADYNDRKLDLGPLKGMPLEHLQLNHVGDLTPLRGAPLKDLLFSGPETKDLSPLAGMPLEILKIAASQISDLSALKDMNSLVHLEVQAPLTDLSPLRGKKLKRLGLGVPAKDLTPLLGMPLEWLGISGVPLDEEQCRIIGELPVRSLHLYQSSVQSLSFLQGTAITSLDMVWMPLPDLAPLRGLKLTHLNLAGCQIARDLSPLEGMSFEVLDLSESSVTDLAPLARSSIKRLNIEKTKVSDLSPLKGVTLEVLSFTPGNIVRGMESLRGMKIIRTIVADGRSFAPEEFWKKYDAGEFK